MTIVEMTIEWFARRLNVPQLAITLFKKANEVSGLGKETIPTELIPLNMIQLSRGLLNFTLLQTIRSWILPFWAEQQYSPYSPAFIPRSHLGLSMNLTHRNWTAVGSMECAIEPIVDPRGMVTLFRDGWSLDVWVMVNGTMFLPSKAKAVHQRLIDDMPVVETSFEIEDIALTLTTFVIKTQLVHRAVLRNCGNAAEHCTLFFALRPFNPEGVSLVHNIEYVLQERTLVVNQQAKLHFSAEPNMIQCSTYEEGDCGNILTESTRRTDRTSAHCDLGLGNAAAGFHAALDPRAEHTVEVRCPLLRRSPDQSGQEPAVRWDNSEAEPAHTWEELLSRGTALTTPDERVNSFFRASLSTLLLLVDVDSITPGPSTYHHFWFRDAAYMIHALDTTGFSHFTEPIIRGFPKKQSGSGYFRSQQGEWDSNGQALWTAWQHARITNNMTLVQDLFPSFVQATTWINNKRLTTSATVGKPYHGLMPRGLSAEHLGHADFYFWDNFWSIAGLESFVGMCQRLDQSKELEQVEDALRSYRNAIDEAIAFTRTHHGTEAITAGPLRGVDCGMIGSLCGWYPLQLFPPTDPRLPLTLHLLKERFSVCDMFFQDFIHSGMNAYLTLQIAHAWLYAGKREQFWRLFAAVGSFASPTMNYPEAIHPTTRGGCMGDGHHGWAAAEIVLALRDAFVFERSRSDSAGGSLILLAGIPAEWFSAGKSFAIERVFIPGGTIGVRVQCDANGIDVEIILEPLNGRLPNSLVLQVPVLALCVVAEGGEVLPHQTATQESHIELPMRSVRLRILV